MGLKISLLGQFCLFILNFYVNYHSNSSNLGNSIEWNSNLNHEWAMNLTWNCRSTYWLADVCWYRKLNQSQNIISKITTSTTICSSFRSMNKAMWLIWVKHAAGVSSKMNILVNSRNTFYINSIWLKKTKNQCYVMAHAIKMKIKMTKYHQKDNVNQNYDDKRFNLNDTEWEECEQATQKKLFFLNFLLYVL